MNHVTYSPDTIVPNLDEIIRAANELQSGCFIFIRNYRSSNGELANYWLHYGRDYVRIKENLIEKLKAILWKGEPFSIDVDYWTWLDKDGEHAVEKECRKEARVRLTGLTAIDPDLEQVLRKMLRTYAVKQMKQARSGTAMPRQFDRQAKGIYIDRKGNIHFRMCTLAIKRVIEPAAKKKYSVRKSAIAQAVRDKFLKLKAFKLGSFESMSIGGQQLVGGAVENLAPELEQAAQRCL